MAELGKREHVDSSRVLLVEALADGGELILGELPKLPLRGLPVVGRHVAGKVRPRGRAVMVDRENREKGDDNREGP